MCGVAGGRFETNRRAPPQPDRSRQFEQLCEHSEPARGVWHFNRGGMGRGYAPHLGRFRSGRTPDRRFSRCAAPQDGRAHMPIAGHGAPLVSGDMVHVFSYRRTRSGRVASGAGSGDRLKGSLGSGFLRCLLRFLHLPGRSAGGANLSRPGPHGRSVFEVSRADAFVEVVRAYESRFDFHAVSDDCWCEVTLALCEDLRAG